MFSFVANNDVDWIILVLVLAFVDVFGTNYYHLDEWRQIHQMDCHSIRLSQPRIPYLVFVFDPKEIGVVIIPFGFLL